MSQPVRLGLFYAALFVGTGASSPYIPVWFASRGLSGAEIGLILSAPMFARAVTAPAIAMWVDSFHLRRTPLILMGLSVSWQMIIKGLIVLAAVAVSLREPSR